MPGDYCAACHSADYFTKKHCQFCNGTDTYNLAAESMMNREYGHPCQCHWTSTNKICPFCGKYCHHKPQNTPKIGSL